MNKFEVYKNNKKYLSVDDCKQLVKDKKITLSQYKELTGNSFDEVDIEIARESKRIEIKKACNEEILAGFYSTAIDGENHLFGYDYEDQQNWSDTLNLINASILTVTAPCKWKGGILQDVPLDNYKVLMQDAMTHKISKISKCDALEATLDNAATVEEIEIIVWNEEDATV